MTYEFVNWNMELLREHIQNGMTEQNFIDQSIREGQYKQYSYDDQKELLSQVYKIALEQR